ncbi:30S ribosomal protein THX [Parapedobacter lycopersici]|nr:30S ribosomal protein THX [Parapedobacter lycopersici]
MGKGDKKTKRGKIVAGSYGKKRPRKKQKKQQRVPSGTAAKA